MSGPYDQHGNPIVPTPPDGDNSNRIATTQFVKRNAGSPLTVTDGTHTVANATEIDFTAGATVTQSGSTAQVAISGGGGSNTVTLTAGTNIAAGTAIGLNSSGHAVQTWGPAPQVAGTATLFGGALLTTGGGVPSALRLSAANFVIFDITGSNAGAQPCSLSGGVVSAGTVDTSTPSTNVSGPATWYVNAVAMSATTFVVAYNDPISGFLSFAFASVSAGAISYGTAAAISTTGNTFGYVPLAMLSATAFVVTYQDSGGAAWIVAGTVSGSTISLGTPVELTTSVGGIGPTIIALSSSEALAAYTDNNHGGAICAVVVSVSGNTVTLNSVAVSANTNGNTWLLFLSASAALVEDGNQNFAVLSISGTTVTFNTFYRGSTGVPTVNSTTDFYVGNTYGHITGTTISFTPLVSIVNPAPGGPPSPHIGGIGSTSPIACGVGGLALGTDLGNTIYEINGATLSQGIEHQSLRSNGYGTYPIDTTRALAVLFRDDGLATARVVNLNPINTATYVMSPAAVTNGSSGSFQTGGVVTGLSGLTAGQEYFLSGDGTLVTPDTGWPIGIALSATSLLMQPGY